MTAATMMVVASSPVSASACGFCTAPGGLKIAHPKSLDVAIAIRRALDAGLLTSSVGPPAETTDRDFEDVQTARMLAQRLYLREPFELLLIEDGSHYWIEGTPQFLRRERSATPAIRLVTGRAVIRGLLARDLTVGVALEKGLIIVEQTSKSQAKGNRPKRQDRRERAIGVAARLQEP